MSGINQEPFLISSPPHPPILDISTENVVVYSYISGYIGGMGMFEAGAGSV